MAKRRRYVTTPYVPKETPKPTLPSVFKASWLNEWFYAALLSPLAILAIRGVLSAIESLSK